MIELQEKYLGSRQIQKIHIDIDPSSFNKSVNVDVTVQGDLKVILEKINRIIEKKKN